MESSIRPTNSWGNFKRYLDVALNNTRVKCEKLGIAELYSNYMCAALQSLDVLIASNPEGQCEVKSGECKNYCNRYCDHFNRLWNCPRFENENESNKTENLLNANNDLGPYLADFIKGKNCRAD